MEIIYISDLNGRLNRAVGCRIELKGNFLGSERHKLFLIFFFFFFNNLTILLHFSILLVYSLFYLKLFPQIRKILSIKMFDLFYLKLFSTNTKILSIKICLISLKLFSFLSKNSKFGMVKIYSINYCYIIIICIFVVIYQSNEVLLKVLDNLQIILLAGALFHLCLSSFIE